MTLLRVHLILRQLDLKTDFGRLIIGNSGSKRKANREKASQGVNGVR